ncbi:hypothetical protein [Caballeronia sp. SBC2]|uniref:hypothetical protein n=1 Tax=Caballeronia sp. SBC2 TaxID=2705547 RepID=UPI0013E1886E|nr:hypothetical protein [Caballeronia sp. SBC2]QIE22949.1 hypothetical protein SBC2_09620 [Caballeronia sp. SBC2]
MYKCFCLLAAALKLQPWEEVAVRPFLEELKRRMEAKALRLQLLLPGITLETSRDAISRASVMVNWRRVEEDLGYIETQQDPEEQAWDLIDMLPVFYEPNMLDMPLAVLPRVSVRTFARRLREALRLDAPYAYELTAQLYGARDWLALAGPKRFLPIAEPIYRYGSGEVAGRPYAWLEPCAAVRQADEEFEAMAQLRQEVFQADLAQNESVDQPGLLCAGSVGATLHLVDREYDIAEWKARSTLEAIDKSYPKDCRLAPAPGSRTHLLYVRLKAVLYVALMYFDKNDEAEAERECLLARGREYRAEYEGLLKKLAPRNSKPNREPRFDWSTDSRSGNRASWLCLNASNTSLSTQLRAGWRCASVTPGSKPRVHLRGAQ